jgi:hypothetical protein
MQAITGIPWFYRQFGYEMGMNLGGWRTAFLGNVPALDGCREEPYRLRPATDADIPFLGAMDSLSCTRSLVGCVRGEALWRYELHGRNPKSPFCREIRVIETPAGDPVGVLHHANHVWLDRLFVSQYELKPGVSWLGVTPAVLRASKHAPSSRRASGSRDP